MPLEDTEKVFGISQADGYQIWQIPLVKVTLPDDFALWLDGFDKLTKLSTSTEAKARCRIDALIVAVYRSLLQHDLLSAFPGAPRVTLAFESHLEWGPVLYKEIPHLCIGKSDYSMFFGEKDHMACHLVIFEAKTGSSVGSTSRGQVLAYMAMVQASRKSRGQSDWTVWGALICGDAWFFIQLNMDGKWSEIYLQSKREGWSEIASMLGSVILHAQNACKSPLRSSLSSTQGFSNQKRKSITPRIASMQLANGSEFVEEMKDFLDKDQGPDPA
ncbi:uncharacterized protein N7511_009937 [Penicillium nucicola]|uniref:uncharacterized protein n=1 Tax=Penicillium nucicola TaxID=1850975 RepID=UPI0025456FF0|nr:uncharacterized protein N7511_009937 [Penicillium nucicola]KAJ5748241.1 hypothetical protein N7511_009937 [Penicillium nucicola]